MVLTELIASLTTSLVSRGFPVSTGGKEPAANARDLRDWGSVPGSGRPPGGGHGNPLQCSSLDSLMDRSPWAVVHGVRVAHDGNDLAPQRAVYDLNIYE